MNIKKLKQLGVVLVSAYVVSGCPSPTVSNLLANNSGASQDAIAQEVTQSNAAESATVNFEVCAAVDSWQRPSDEVQAKRLGGDARYSESLASSSLKAASTQFWDQQVISFTTYGLSARMEPETLSGVWTAADELASCYALDATVAINEGDRAETWLLNQKISDLQWVGDRYIMTVEPAATGLQVVQFDRMDKAAKLPLEVVTASGNSVGVTSGDWQ